MATLKVGNQKGKYFDSNSKEDVIHYILQPHKTIHNFYGTFGISVPPGIKSRQILSEYIANRMNHISVYFGKSSGVQLHHFIISFSPYELHNPALAYRIAYECAGFFAPEYQVVYAVHEDSHHLHIHIVINSVSYVDGHKYRGSKEEFYELKKTFLQVLNDYGISKLIYIHNKKSNPLNNNKV